jgi:hypothetical protein
MSRLATRAAALAIQRRLTLQAGSHRIPLHWALLNGSGAYVELSVLPVAVSWGMLTDRTLSRTRLAAAEVTEIGPGLYGRPLPPIERGRP